MILKVPIQTDPILKDIITKVIFKKTFLMLQFDNHIFFSNTNI